MKRSGFTMIELVFVIVILGILASVAIPKLAATRDDAQIAKASTEIASLISDMGSYYTAQGGFDNNVSVMTNVKLTNAATTGDAGTLSFKHATGVGAAVYYSDITRAVPCITITSVDVNGTVTLSPTTNSDNSLFCKGLKKSVASLIKEHIFGGSSIYK